MVEKVVKFEIELNLLREVVSYLSKQPYQDVAVLISHLGKLKEIDNIPNKEGTVSQR